MLAPAEHLNKKKSNTTRLLILPWFEGSSTVVAVIQKGINDSIDHTKLLAWTKENRVAARAKKNNDFMLRKKIRKKEDEGIKVLSKSKLFIHLLCSANLSSGFAPRIIAVLYHIVSGDFAPARPTERESWKRGMKPKAKQG